MKNKFLCIFLMTCLAAVSEVKSQGFDCLLAQSDAGLRVCSNRDLSRLDLNLNQIYTSMKDRPGMRDQQKRWLIQRNLCGKDTSCLLSTYSNRIDQLRSLASNGSQNNDNLGTGGGRAPSSSTSEDCRRFPGLC